MESEAADSVHVDKRFRLLQDEEGSPPSPIPIPLPHGVGQPPRKPPLAPPLADALEPEPEPEKQKETALELRIKELEKDNEWLLAALYHFQQECENLRGPKY